LNSAEVIISATNMFGLATKRQIRNTMSKELRTHCTV